MSVKYIIFFVVLITLIQHIDAQELSEDSSIVDSLYREDQVYLGVTFNLLANRSDGFSQNGLSGGFQIGFIRDMPINKRRNKAIGVGLGVGLDTFNHNLFIGEEADGETSIFSIIPSDINEDENRFTFYTLQMPIQYRWRTSTPTKYTFWRIHAGVQLGYIFRFKSTFRQTNNTVTQTDIPELNELRYGLTFAFGYGAFNFQAYYGLNPLFDSDATINRETVDLQVIRLGLQFYFL